MCKDYGSQRAAAIGRPSVEETERREAHAKLLELAQKVAREQARQIEEAEELEALDRWLDEEWDYDHRIRVEEQNEMARKYLAGVYS